MRTFRQMYGDIEPMKILTPIGQTTLTAYSGEEIKCLGSITLGCKSGSSSWVNVVFYIVDVPGPVILGLPTCEALNLVTINCQLESVVTAPVKLTSVQVVNRKEPMIASANKSILTLTLTFSKSKGETTSSCRTTSLTSQS